MSDHIPGYTAIHWEPLDLLSDEMMDRVNANIQAVHDHTPRVFFTNPGGAMRTTGVKIASGRILIPRQPRRSEVTSEVAFGGFFSSGCRPNITTGINAKLMQNIYCTFSGINGAGLLPNNTGFRLHVQIAKEDGEKVKIARNMYIHWQAMGY